MVGLKRVTLVELKRVPLSTSCIVRGGCLKSNMRFRRILGSKGVYLSAGKGGKLNKKAVFFDDGGIGGNFGGCIPAQLSQQRLVFFRITLKATPNLQN